MNKEYRMRPNEKSHQNNNGESVPEKFFPLNPILHLQDVNEAMALIKEAIKSKRSFAFTKLLQVYLKDKRKEFFHAAIKEFWFYISNRSYFWSELSQSVIEDYTLLMEFQDFYNKLDWYEISNKLPKEVLKDPQLWDLCAFYLRPYLILSRVDLPTEIIKTYIYVFMPTSAADSNILTAEILKAKDIVDVLSAPDLQPFIHRLDWREISNKLPKEALKNPKLWEMFGPFLDSFQIIKNNDLPIDIIRNNIPLFNPSAIIQSKKLTEKFVNENWTRVFKYYIHELIQEQSSLNTAFFLTEEKLTDTKRYLKLFFKNRPLTEADVELLKPYASSDDMRKAETNPSLTDELKQQIAALVVEKEATELKQVYTLERPHYKK